MSKEAIENATPAVDIQVSDDVVKQEAPAQADQAAGFLLNAEGYGPLTPEAEKALKRKIDWIMIPMVSSGSCVIIYIHTDNSQLWLVATLGAVDKVALSTAALYGFRADNHLVGQQYSWLGSILSIGVSHSSSCRL